MRTASIGGAEQASAKCDASCPSARNMANDAPPVAVIGVDLPTDDAAQAPADEDFKCTLLHF